jgi:hypothetical protein
VTLYAVCCSPSFLLDSIWTDENKAIERKIEIRGVVMPYEPNHAPAKPGGTVCACGEPVYLECKALEVKRG